ncbi:MAG: dihydrolipoamide succinyltransferase, partial [Pseudomonadales bacterium]
MDIKAPTFPESINEGTVAVWHKRPGEPVARDDLLVDIETDKVVLEVVAPGNGALTEILKDEGEIVESEEVIARFEASEQSLPTPPPEPQPAAESPQPKAEAKPAPEPASSA